MGAALLRIRPRADVCDVGRGGVSSVCETLLGVFGAIVFGVGMCMTMVWNILVPGVIVGIVGIVLLLCLIPVIKGLK